VAAGGGFGDASAPKASKKAPKIARYLERGTGPEGPAATGASDGWFAVPDVDAVASFVSKPIKPVILATGRAIMLYKVGETVYCSDAASTAYSYPLADANLLSVKGRPAVEVKLDGTVYDLATGKVISWCPKNTAVRKVLGALKDRAEPQDLPVFPVRLEGSAVWVKLG
jgi:nitrite reductase/ring-hydroxylating ferredoxin subunit